MRPILTVTEAAGDLLLLTEAEARRAAGVASGQDANILALRKSASAAITSRCNVWADGAVPATLRLETLSQQVRLDCPVEEIRLGRRPVVEVLSATEDDVAVTSTDWEINPATGMLRRLCNGYPSFWFACRKVVITYRAGWAVVPENLKAAAMRLATAMWTQSTRDPELKSMSIPGVIEEQYWVGPIDDPLISREIEDLLAEYVNPTFA